MLVKGSTAIEGLSGNPGNAVCDDFGTAFSCESSFTL